MTGAMTRAAFLVAYEKQVRAYQWAGDQARFETFMAKVRETLDGRGIPWAWNSDGSIAAWKEIGGKGKPTLKALRALP